MGGASRSSPPLGQCSTTNRPAAKSGPTSLRLPALYLSQAALAPAPFPDRHHASVALAVASPGSLRSCLPLGIFTERSRTCKVDARAQYCPHRRLRLPLRRTL